MKLEHKESLNEIKSMNDKKYKEYRDQINKEV